MATIAYLLEQRDKARANGDKSQARAIDADLARLGYHGGTVPPPEPTPGFETAAVEAPEQAVPAAPKKRATAAKNK